MNIFEAFFFLNNYQVIGDSIIYSCGCLVWEFSKLTSVNLPFVVYIIKDVGFMINDEHRCEFDGQTSRQI